MRTFMLEHMWASRFTPLQMRRQNCERRGVFRKSLIAGLALVFVITSISAFAAPATAAAADPGSTLGPSIQYQEALAHAGKTYSFTKGGVVKVPYRPRPSDTTTVDGAAPAALPAALESGVAAPSMTGSAATSGATVNVLRREVFGFLPYWQLGTTLNYPTLSTVAYFGIGLNVNLSNPADPAIGTLDKTGNGWNGWVSTTMTNVINAAHAAGTRAVLTIESFAWDTQGQQFQSQILGTDAVRLKTAQAIAAEVGRRGADGVNLDFEPIASGQKTNFVSFVRTLRAELDKVHQGYELTFCANGSAGTYDLAGALAAGAADAVFIMGYDLRGGSPAKTGSIDPLVSNSATYTLSSIVHYFLTHGAPASKTILGLPWYGHAWSVGQATPPVVNAPPGSIPTYGPPATGVTYETSAGLAAKDPATTPCDAGEPVPCVTGEQYDPVEETAWVGYYGNYGGTQPTWRELYYDNPRSLGAKCDAIDGWDLRGVGIWALGYDNGGGNGDLTNEIAVKFLSVMTPATYHPIAPVRVLDTRSGKGLSGRIMANTPRTFQVAGRDGIAADATSITGNVTVVNPTNSWAVYLGPAPVAVPTSSTINFKRGETLGNGLTVALSPGGALSATYMSTAGNWTDLVLDVTGYYTGDSTGGTYHAVAPVRMLDSRSANGLSGKFAANVPRTFQVAGRGTVPANAVAVTGNVTVVNSTAGWAAYLGPVAAAAPTTSTINFVKGEVKGNNLTMTLDSKGALSATFMSSPGNTTDIVFDVTGYYTADATGARFVPMTPTRLLDTRIGLSLIGKFAANTARTFQTSGRGGVSYAAIGITGNLTVVNPTNGWAAYVGPDALAKPTTSTINFVKGDVRGNGFTVAVSSTGSLSATYVSSAGNTADLILDVTGYFAP
jgi:spore germination protein YaaH